MPLKIGVVGSSSSKGINSNIIKKAELVGKFIADNGCLLLTGCAGGISDAACKGAKKYNGFVIGVSPASNFKEHVSVYKLPSKYIDVLIYTGFGYKGRNVVLVRSCDAIIVISGGIGTLNEFTIAFDEGKNIGILKGSGLASDYLIDVMKKVKKKSYGKILIESKPERIVQKIIEVTKNLKTKT